MVQLKIPVTVTYDTKQKVEALAEAVRQEISPQARRAVSTSSICVIAIENLISNYEKNPKGLAVRMGFALSDKAK